MVIWINVDVEFTMILVNVLFIDVFIIIYFNNLIYDYVTVLDYYLFMITY
jgi:hypothetical protein